MTAIAITAVLFVSPARTEGLEAALQTLALIGIYTFVYSVAGIFIGVGALLALYRQVELRERGGGRVLQVASVLGRTWSVQSVDFDAPLSLPRLSAPSPVPASVAALHLVVTHARLERSEASIAERVPRLSRTSNRIVRECVELALVSLAVQGAVRIRPARVRLASRLLSPRPTHEVAVHLLEPGPEQAVSGALELLLLERIRAWPRRQRGEYPFATAGDLVRSFEDSEGDFSARHLLRTVEEEGVEKGWFDRRPRLSTRRLLPEPRAAEGVSLTEAARGWTRVREEVRDRAPRLLDEIERDLRSVLDPRNGSRTTLELAQSRLRRSIFRRLVAVSASLATAVCLLSRLA